MKKALVLCAVSFLFIGCTKKQEKLDERKENYSSDHLVNKGVDSAAAASETDVPTSTKDTIQ